MRILVWELPVRIIHWINVLLITVLFATGLYIGWPLLSPAGEAFAHASLAWVIFAHVLCGFLLLAAMLFRFYWWFVGNDSARNGFRFWDKVAWSRLFRLSGHLLTARADTEAAMPSEDPLARLAQQAFFLASLFMVVTGFAMYGEANPHGWAAFLTGWAFWFMDSRAMHYWHHMVAWFFPLFVVAHVYMVVRTDVLEGKGLISSMVTGYYSNWKEHVSS